MRRRTIINPKTGRRVYADGVMGKQIIKKKKIINPKTGRRVYADGVTGKQVLKKAKKAKSKESKAKTSQRPKGKGKGGPIKNKYYGYEGATKKPSPPIKTAGITKCFAARPSARDCFDRRMYGPVFYGGHWHVMAFRENGSPFWKRM